MSMRPVAFLIAGLALLAAAACGDDDNAASPTTTVAAGSLVWEQVAPPGSGGFMPYPGSGDEPKWEPGKYPMTLHPVIGWNGEMWMTSTTLAFSSPDGLEWTKYDKDETPGYLAATFTFFNDKMWMYAGNHYRTDEYSNEVWSSTDGVTWRKEGNAEWPGRDSTTLVTFQEKLWVFGGANHRDPVTLNTDQFLNDVWSSEDGLHWTQVTATAPWSPRDYAKVVVFNDTLYMLGGNGESDVWTSTNGKDWTQLTPNAAWGTRDAFAAVAYDGKLWVFGGYIGKSTNTQNDVWYSEDGVTWTQQTAHAPWTPRDAIAIVFKDKLWLFAGKATGSKDSWNGDIWTLS